MFGLFNLFGNAPVFCGVRHADLDLGGVIASTVPTESLAMERASALDDGLHFQSFDPCEQGSASIGFAL